MGLARVVVCSRQTTRSAVFGDPIGYDKTARSSPFYLLGQTAFLFLSFFLSNPFHHHRCLVNFPHSSSISSPLSYVLRERIPRKSTLFFLLILFASFIYLQIVLVFLEKCLIIFVSNFSFFFFSLFSKEVYFCRLMIIQNVFEIVVLYDNFIQKDRV